MASTRTGGNRRPRQQSQARHELMAQQIQEAAAALFAERGFARTSLQEVADALQISRTALYHYIGGKEELLTMLVRGFTKETADSLRELADDPRLDPIAKLVEAIRGMAVRIATNPARFRLLLVSEGSLPEPLAREHLQNRRRSLEHLTTIIAQGVASGQLRPIDERLAAFAVLGMTNWVAWWYRPQRGTGRTPEQVASTFVQMALLGLQSPVGRSPRDAHVGVGHAIELLREDLDYLERLLAIAAGKEGQSNENR